MQDLLLTLLDNNPELSRKLCQLSHAMPGYQEATQAFEALENQIRERLGFELYDQYVTAFTRLLDYDVRAAYALGLGLRKELAKALKF